MAAPKFLARITGRIKEIATIQTSAGAADANKVPATGADGKLDSSLVPSSGGAAKTVRTVTADDTWVLGDAGNIVEMNSTDIHKFTIPPNSAVAIAVGSVVQVHNINTGRTYIEPGAAVTILSNDDARSLKGQGAVVFATKRATDTWELTGDLEQRPIGALWTWGDAANAKNGDGQSFIPQAVPKRAGRFMGSDRLEVAYKKSFIALGGSSTSRFAIATDGTLFGWGAGTNGAFGTNDAIDKGIPMQLFTDKSFLQIDHFAPTVAITSDGGLWVWGQINSGDGAGGTTNVSSPIHIGTRSWFQVAAHGGGYFAIDTLRALWAVGNNASGRLGTNDGLAYSSLVQLMAGSSWNQIKAATGAGFGIRSDGGLWTWGSNGSGELGNGTAVATSSPTHIGTESWMMVAPGSSICHAIRTDGKLFGWGLNNVGQVGDNTTTNRSSPVQIAAGTSWMFVNGGNVFTIGMDVNGDLWGWGQNSTFASGMPDATNGTSWLVPTRILTDRKWKTIQQARNGTTSQSALSY